MVTLGAFTRRRFTQSGFMLATFIALSAPAARAATLPPGFTETLIANGLSNPTAMQFAPDGRLFVCEQGGRLRVIKDGVLLPTPFITLSVSASGERGLLGVAFDPAFLTNPYVYVYYTATSPTVHNRISRFTANGDVAVAGSEVVLLDLDNLSSATNHNGGALHFGPDGKLYAAAGDNASSSNAQSMNNLLGKVLRLNADGSIPADNPFYSSTTGRNRAIWALGLRNPFTFAFNPSGTEMFVNDVGEGSWEEINVGIAGANYGWPATEGATSNPQYDTPRYSYGHTGGQCAINGGAFYSPLTNRFPSDYSSDYFFADHCAGWIRRLDPATGSVATFATGLSVLVDLKVSDDGGLYYLARDSGAVYRIDYGTALPGITSHPVSRTVQPGESVTFSVSASGPPVLRYQWQRNGVSISGATQDDYTLTADAIGQRRQVPGDRQQRRRKRDQQRSGADRFREPGADRYHHPTVGRHSLQRRQRRQRTLERRRIPRTARCRVRPLRGAWTSITTRTSIHSWPRPPARPAGRSPSRRRVTPKSTSGIEST